MCGIKLSNLDPCPPVIYYVYEAYFLLAFWVQGFPGKVRFWDYSYFLGPGGTIIVASLSEKDTSTPSDSSAFEKVASLAASYCRIY